MTFLTTGMTPKTSSRTEERRKRLKAYREEQRALAIRRDGGACQLHLRLKGELVRGTEVHHVHRRGRREGDERERYINLLCLCPSCHHAVHDYEISVVDIMRVLAKANRSPANEDFD